MRYIFPKWTAEGAGNCGELSPHSILQRRAYVSCRGCVGIPPSAWGQIHEIRVVPRIKGQALFVPDRRAFFCRGRFVLHSFGRRAGGVFAFTERGSGHEDTAHALHNFTICEEEMTEGHFLFAFFCKFWSSKCIERNGLSREKSGLETTAVVSRPQIKL